MGQYGCSAPGWRFPIADTEHNDLVQATGLAIALIGSLLEGRGLLPKGEFNRHLANLGQITGETDAAQGELLDGWAAISAQASRAAH